MALDTLFPLPLGAFIMVLVPYLLVPNSKRSWHLGLWCVALGSQTPGTDNGILLWWNLINISSRADKGTQSQGVLLGDVLSAMSRVLTAVLGWNYHFGWSRLQHSWQHSQAAHTRQHGVVHVTSMQSHCSPWTQSLISLSPFLFLDITLQPPCTTSWNVLQLNAKHLGFDTNEGNEDKICR